MNTKVRFRWGEMKLGQKFTIVLNGVINATTTYHKQFIVIPALYDVGVEPFAYVGCPGATTDGTLYTPNFGLAATFDAKIRPQLDPDRFQFEITSVGQSGGQKSFSIYGSTPISFQVLPLEAGDGEYTFVDATLSLEPTEWWSYGGTYNTSTGARL